MVISIILARTIEWENSRYAFSAALILIIIPLIINNFLHLIGYGPNVIIIIGTICLFISLGLECLVFAIEDEKALSVFVHLFRLFLFGF